MSKKELRRIYEATKDLPPPRESKNPWYDRCLELLQESRDVAAHATGSDMLKPSPVNITRLQRALGIIQTNLHSLHVSITQASFQEKQLKKKRRA